MNKNRIVRCACLVGTLLACLVAVTYGRIREKVNNIGISNVTVRTVSNGIHINWDWDWDGTTNTPDIKLLITEVTNSEDAIYKGRLHSGDTYVSPEWNTYTISCMASEEGYLFTDGIPGTLYEISVVLDKPSNDTITPGEENIYTVRRMFMDYDSIPDIPLLDIETDSGQIPSYEEAVTREEKILGRTIRRKTKETANLSVSKGDIPTSEYRTKVSLRGNTSTVLYDKKTYKLSFENPVDIMGLGEQSARTEWVLLANASNLRTWSGFQVADICDLEWQLPMKYVNVILNGDWLGCYILTENIGYESAVANNLVSDTGYVFENDMYWWNTHGIYFKTPYLNEYLGYTFKYPELKKRNDYRIYRINDYMTAFEGALFEDKGNYADYIDVDNWASWILARDILANSDGGGSNMYLYKYDYDINNPLATKVKMGPLWDFDLVFENPEWSSSRDDDVFYFTKLLEQHDFQKSYVDKWQRISPILSEEIDNRYEMEILPKQEELSASWLLDDIRWCEPYTSVESKMIGVREFFAERTKWIDSQLESR